MPLTNAARRRATEDLQAWVDETVQLTFPSTWTLELTPEICGAFVQSLVGMAEQLPVEVPELNATTATFIELQEWTVEVIDLITPIRQRMTALARFAPFGGELAKDVLDQLSACVRAALNAIETGAASSLPSFALDPATIQRLRSARGTPHPLRSMFGLDWDPVDASGEFKPGRVMERYAYQPGALMGCLVPHLASLGLRPVNDALASIAMIGWIVTSPNPPLAAWGMHVAINIMFAPGRHGIRAEVLDAHRSRDSIARQSRARTLSDLAAAAAVDSEEQRAHLLASAYRRVVEGPVRQSAWAIICMARGSSSKTPNLGQVRELMIAHNEFLRAIASSSIFPGLRNAQAHETLEWDGVDRVVRGEGDTLTLDQLREAIELCITFDRGCEAAFTFARALRAGPAIGTPSELDEMRMPPWMRAESFFASNGLVLEHLETNSRLVKATVKQLGEADINPCFQALVVLRRLLPRAQAFEVVVADEAKPSLTVDFSALDDSLAALEYSHVCLSATPLSAFLPANLNARMRSEVAPVALRSISWIAVDDVLDAIDGSPALIDERGRRLLLARIATTRIALESCHSPEGVQVDRGGLVRNQLVTLSERLAIVNTPFQIGAIERWEPVIRLRHWLTAWGPVERLPGIGAATRGRVPSDVRSELLDGPRLALPF
jgi:hypothetical protein